MIALGLANCLTLLFILSLGRKRKQGQADGRGVAWRTYSLPKDGGEGQGHRPI